MDKETLEKLKYLLEINLFNDRFGTERRSIQLISGIRYNEGLINQLLEMGVPTFTRRKPDATEIEEVE